MLWRRLHRLLAWCCLAMALACRTSATTSSNPNPPNGGPPHHGTGNSPYCGLDAAAFCDNFDQGPTATPGREGDLDPSQWSAGRLSPQEISGPGKANPAPPAQIPSCRASLNKSTVYPDEDTLICDPTNTQSAQLLTAVAMQNYGLNSYRIRQPFDFAGRTGKIVFDVDAVMVSGLAAWVSVEVTEDPIPAPSFLDYERGPLPRNGMEIQFNNDYCARYRPGSISVGRVDAYGNYALTPVTPVYPPDWTVPDCVATQQGNLNHFEIRISQTNFEVLGSEASPDGGKSFPNFHTIASGTFNLAFTRGYVHITARNHATVKYGFGPNWVYHWDNVAFDGPVISNWLEYEVPDSLTPSGTNVNTGYIITEHDGMFTCCPTQRVASLALPGVDLKGAVRAQLAFNSFYLNCCGAPNDLTTLNLRYRFNAGTWRDRFVTAAEADVLRRPYSQGDLAQIIEVPLGDLVQGTNTLEFLTVNEPQSYPTVLANIDLIIQTN